MTRKKRPKLSEAQLRLMQILWDREEATVTEVWQALPDVHRGARTTVMTVLSRLAERGWLHRQTRDGELLYTPAVEREEALSGMLSRLLEVGFGGSAERLVHTLVNARGLSGEEAAELRRIIEESARKKP